MAEPRFEAVKLLTKIEKDSSYSSILIADAFRNVKFPDSKDTAFAVSLVYGVLEKKLTLDYNISLYLTSKLSKLKPEVLSILRTGAYQILFCDKIPDSAAVNEAVKISKKSGSAFASGLINAVLRKISLNGIKLPENNLSIKYSVNDSIAQCLVNDYGYEKTVEILESFKGRRPIFIRVNTLKCTAEELIKSLDTDGVIAVKTKLENCLTVENTGDITRLQAFRNGWFFVQDMSSQLCCKLAGVKPGYTVIDCCAAPGGKTFSMAQYLGNTGKITSCDMYEHKTKLISDTAERLGIKNVVTICSDARQLPAKLDKADVVLCDVPCSGFGVMGRKPEIRYKKTEELTDIPAIQKEILYSCCELVKPGGTLVYSTCTLNKKENDLICDAFLEGHPDFRIADDDYYRSLTERYITVFPAFDGGDGFFIAKFFRGT